MRADDDSRNDVARATTQVTDADTDAWVVDDDELVASWSLLSDAYLTVAVRLSQGLDAVGQLTLPQFDILSRLLLEPGHTLLLSRLAAEVGLSAGGVAKLVNRMELDGLVVCESVGPRQDTLAATITDHGRELTRASADHHRRVLQRHLLAPLGVNGLRALDTLTRALRHHHG